MKLLIIHKKRKGSGVLVIALALCIITSIIGAATARIANTMFSTSYANNINVQANEYAQDKAETLKATPYEIVSTQAKTAINGSNDYYDEVQVKTVSQRKYIFIKIFHGTETEPRATTDLVRDRNANTGCPIGTIVAWPSATLPTDGGTWLKCDGSVIPERYSILRSLLHSSTTPSTPVGSFLRGYGSAAANHVSGNLMEWQDDATIRITGSFYTFPPQFIAHYGTDSSPWKNGFWLKQNVSPSGIFTGGEYAKYATKFDRQDTPTMDNATYKYPIVFDNSLFIRASTETRPINMAVNFIIKAQ